MRIKNNIRNLFILLLVFWGYSGKAQENYYFHLKNSDVYNALEIASEEYSKKIYQLVLDKKINTYKDSTLKHRIKDKEISQYFEFTDTIQNKDDPYILISYSLYEPRSFSNIIITQNYIECPTFLPIRFYISSSEVAKFYDNKDSSFANFITTYSDGNISENNAKNYEDSFLENKGKSFWEKMQKGNLNGYKNPDFINLYTKKEIDKIIQIGKQINKYQNDSFVSGCNCDSLISTAIALDTISGLGVIYSKSGSSNIDFQMKLISIFPSYNPIIGNVKLRRLSHDLFFKTEDILNSFNNDEKYIWNLMIDYNFRHKLTTPNHINDEN